MLMPKKVRHRKHHRGRMRGASKGQTEITFGEFGIQALSRAGSRLVRLRPPVLP
ncbi:MAG: hypothetical protein Ct9H300mP31_02340 [Acidimicrobiaceae bacterium]|nr:MAG: hypothetical protein Ct9H300mP31_02340 [Acidimicrobiaceae bacterium]